MCKHHLREVVDVVVGQMLVSKLHVLLKRGPLGVREDGLDGGILPQRYVRLQIDKQCHVL